MALLFYEDVYGDPGTEAGVTSVGWHFVMDDLSKKVAKYILFPLETLVKLC